MQISQRCRIVSATPGLLLTRVIVWRSHFLADSERSGWCFKQSSCFFSFHVFFPLSPQPLAKREPGGWTMYSFLKMWSHNFVSLHSFLCHLCNQIDLSNFRPINVNGLRGGERGGVWLQGLSGSTCASEPAAPIIVTSVASASPCRRSSGPENFAYRCAGRGGPSGGVQNKNRGGRCAVK